MSEKASSPFLPLASKYAEALGTTLLELSVSSARSFFSHMYYLWRTAKGPLGVEGAYKAGLSIWEAFGAYSLQASMEAMGITEVKDLQTFGKIVQNAFTGVPCFYIIKRDEPDEHVGHVVWCPNPVYGPADNVFNRHDYYLREVPLTIEFLKVLESEAKKVGFPHDLEIEMPTGRCRDGTACACQIVIRTANADKSRPLPEVEERRIEEEMGDAEPYLHIIEQQGRTLEEQGPASFITFPYTDYLVWQALVTIAGDQKGLEIYLDLWRTYAPTWARDARVDMWLGKPETPEALAGILAYAYKRMYMPYKLGKENGRVLLTSYLNPYVEVMSAFGFESDHPYFKVVATRDREFLNMLIREAKAPETFTATLTRAIGDGAEVNQIEVTST